MIKNVHPVKKHKKTAKLYEISEGFKRIVAEDSQCMAAGVRNQVGRVSNRVPRLQVWCGLRRGLDSSILQARYERFRYQR